MFKIFTASSLLGMLFSFSALGQKAPIRPCGTTEAVEKALREHPELIENLRKLDEETKHFITGVTADSVLTIPVVFHVFHTYGSERISELQIRDAIRLMNADFLHRNADSNLVSAPFKSRVGTTNFRFRLAKKDPQGRCTEGINYFYSDLHKAGGDNMKSIVSWDTKRYLNIWTCSVVENGSAAYSYYPGSAPGTSNEGIVSRSDYVGSIGNSNSGHSRTLSHETGHYFNLPHTWGSSNEPGLATNCNIDDGVQDTPNCKGVVGNGCNLNQMSCGFLDNVENIMEYSSCRRMFTQGQSTRMRAASNSTAGGRKFMWVGSNLIATGTTNDAPGPECPPKTDFKNTISRICAGGTVTFTELAYNVQAEDSVKFSWKFDGGSPATSTLGVVTVTYPNPGTYPVKLVSRNAAGKDSLVRTNWITVLPTETAYYSFQTESFETTTFPNFPTQSIKNWEINSSIASSWKRTTTAHVTGNASLSITNNTNTDGATHELYSPVFEITGGNDGAKINFKYAFAQRATTNTDRFVVSYSTNCGKTWYPAFNKNGTSLATKSGVVSGTFTPASQDWRQENVSMSLLGTNSKLRLKFEFTSGSGNNFYLDDLQITNVTAQSNLQDDNLALFVVPNPSMDLPVLNIESAHSQKGAVEITDQLGRSVLLYKALDLNPGSNRLDLNGQMDKPKSGTYFVRLVLQNRVMVRQWVVLP